MGAGADSASLAARIAHREESQLHFRELEVVRNATVVVGVHNFFCTLELYVPPSTRSLLDLDLI